MTLTTFRTDSLWADLLTHARFGVKPAGSAGDNETANWIEAELSGCGYDVQRLPVPVATFLPDRCELAGQDCSLELYPQPIVVPTPPRGITARLALVHDVSDAIVARDRIAVLVVPHARHAAIWTSSIGRMLEICVEAGALAVIILPCGPTGDIVALNTFADRPSAPIPLAIGRPSDLPVYASNAAASIPMTMFLTGTQAEGDSPTLIGRLKRGSRHIALSTPRSCFFTGSVERGTGTAAFLALARWLPQAFPDHSLFLLNSGAHELRFAGTHAALDQAPPAAETDVWAHIGAGLASRAQSTIRGGRRLVHADTNRVCMTTPSLLEDASLAFAGLPGLDDPQEILSEAGELSTIASRGYERAFAVLGVNRTCHTRHDLPEDVCPELLEPVAVAHARLIDMAVTRR